MRVWILYVYSKPTGRLCWCFTLGFDMTQVGSLSVDAGKQFEWIINEQADGLISYWRDLTNRFSP